MERKTWGVTGVISGVFMIVFFIWFGVAIDDTITTQSVADCKAGLVTPEELGYPELSCYQIEDKQNSDLWSEMLPFSLCCVTMIYSIIALLIAAFKKDNLAPVDLATYSQQTAQLQLQLQQTQANLMQAQGSYQQIQHEHQQAEQQLAQYRIAQTQMAGQSEAAHRARMMELEVAEQRARQEMDAAKLAVELANKSKLESEEAAEKARVERLAVQGAQQQLVQAAQNIAPQPTQSQTPQFNVNIVNEGNKEYKDSVHQEDK